MPEICRVVEEAKFNAREKRYNNPKPQPWIVLKLVVFFTVGIMGYTGYVYIGRFCLDAIRGRRNGVSKGTGIALLVIFCILYLWMLWAYLMVVITSPGYARDYVSKSPPPFMNQDQQNPATVPNGNVPPTDVEHSGQGEPNGLGPTTHTLTNHNRDSIGGPSYEDMQFSEETYPPQIEPQAGTLDALPHPNTIATAAVANGAAVVATQNGDAGGRAGKRSERIRHALQRAEAQNAYRRPPTTPQLLPEHRYCSKDLFIKPHRAHHCRACGTCVLKYDHHCPWIGQCVGARNHKFFLNFNQATSIFTAYTFGTLVGFSASNTFADGDIDVQIIVIIALAGLFFIFTVALMISHTHLLCISQTTVESMMQRTMQEREDAALARVFPLWDVSSKTKVRKEWDKEWGRIGREGNIWWLGNARKGWEDTMGSASRSAENPWGWVAWVLPLKLRKPKEWGLDYEVNPRFDKVGRWRRRDEWPEELR
ncbi:hypothetical protein AAF712_015551 [Marasmius tenuissimus]|uniref:Palmitoyltransferase n=1 Tax=Marasmius tenuissimus TaxID=585030 RepID=A0ABR2Z912_9AGAR